MESNFTIDIMLDRRYKKTSGLYPVKLWAYDSAKQKSKRFKTKYSFSVKDFDSIWNTSKPRNEHKDARNELDAIKSKAVSDAKKIVPFSLETFKKNFERKSGEGDNVFYHYQQVIDELTKSEQLGTASSYEQSMKSLKKFIESKNGAIPESLSFREITGKWLERYEKYMIAEPQAGEKKKARSKTTVGIYLRALRAIFNRAIEDKDIASEIYPFGKKGYGMPGMKRVKKALSRAELKKLFEAIPPTPEQQKAKDFWFFSYSCNGANIKDIALLRFENLQNDTFRFIRAKTINTSKENLTEVVVYLTEHAKQVIEKYGNKSKDPKEFVFPILSITDSAKQRRSKIQNFTKFTNTHIKKLAIAEGINADISTYFARHSFASNAIRQGASMEFVMEALSHSNLQTTKGYFAGFEDETKKEFMEGLMKF